ncbi:MAG TPA: YiiX/YebB-like N1pC/P60 family cysteine hydrolase [Phycisphaerae bacterium]|nr:YiiX/YebB-like N1pC/P60 family cysteine hydrolase [Phycisphaerae bacterium]
MATHIANAQKVGPTKSYAALRPQLRSGDLFFCAGRYLVSRAIQHMTGSPWSHVGIIIRAEKIDRVLLLESVEDMGVRFAPLSKYLDDYEDARPYRGEMVVARVSALKQSDVPKIAEFGVDELTRPYDKDEIAKIIARIALGLGRKERDREYICSELVFECFAHAGMGFAYNPKGFISPEDVWTDPQVLVRFENS